MLEGIASSILTKYLGDYVEGLDKKNLDISISSGDAVLTNMKLKKSALKDLELPVEVKEGYLGKLTLKIPWKSIGSKPAIVKIEGVYIVATPKRTDSSADEVNRTLQSKLQQLQLAELLGFDKPKEEEEKVEKKGDGFFSRLVMKVVDNLQIFIDDIHIRFEDNVSNPQKPFTFGLTLDSLHAQSTDENWVPTFLNVGADIVHKLVTLRNLSFYMNTSAHEEFLSFKSSEELSAAMRKLIPTDDDLDSQNHDYILKPISGVLKAQIDRGETFVKERPKIKIQSELESLFLSINSSQFKRIMDLQKYVDRYFRVLEYAEYKPKERPLGNPKAWWKYAFTCLTHDQEKKDSAWQWSSIKKHLNSRDQYIKLFKLRIRQTLEKMKESDRKELEKLEETLSYNNIILFRKLAYASIKREDVKHESKGFFSRMFRSKEAENIDETAALKELYDAIGYEETKEQQTQETALPPDYVKVQVDFMMKEGAFILSQSDQQKDVPLGSLNFHQLSASMKLREEWKTFNGSLKTLEFIEHHTLDSKPLVAIKPSFVDSSRENFMNMQFDLNPLDEEKPVDVRLNIDSKPLLIYFSMPLIDKIVDFFKTDSPFDAEIFTDAATAGFSMLKKQAEMGMKYNFQKKSKVKIDIKLDAPKVICPKDYKDPHSSSIILDLGSISVSSDPYWNEKQISPSKEIEVSEDYFYDQFSIDMVGLHIVAISGKETSWNDIDAFDHHRYSIVKRFDFLLQVKVCNEQTSDLAKIKVSSSIPSLVLSVTQPRISTILEVVESITKKKESAPDAIEPKSQKFRPKSKKLRKISGTLPGTKNPSIKKRRSRQVTISEEPSAEIKKLGKNDIGLDLEFELGELIVNLYEFKNLESPDEQSGIREPLVKFCMDKLHFNMRQSTFDMRFNTSLYSMQIKDRGVKENFMLMTDNDGGDAEILTINYVNIPKESPLYEDVDNEMKISFGKVIFNVNRPTLAGLLQTINNIVLSMNKNQEQPAVVPEIEGDIKKEEKLKLRRTDPFSIYKLEASLLSIQVNMNRQDKILSEFVLTESKVNLDVRDDNNLHITGSLGSINLQDRTIDEKWSNLISVKDSNEMISFSFSKYDQMSIEYPGHDMELNLKMNTLKLVFLNKSVKQFTDYFAGFEKMRQLVQAASMYYYSASIDAIKDAAKNVTKFKFNIGVRNPQIIMPVNSLQDDHIIANLGNINLHNAFKSEHGNETDRITISVRNLNVQTLFPSRETKLVEKVVDDIATEVYIVRQLYPEKAIHKPKIEIKMNVPAFNLSLSETQLSFLLLAMRQNVGEEYSSRDDELNLVVDALKTVDFDVEQWKYDHSEEEKQEVSVNPQVQNLKIDFSLSTVNILLLTGDGFEKETGYRLDFLEFKVHKIYFTLNTMEDSTTNMNVVLKGAYLTDVRYDTSIKFRNIWSPKLAKKMDKKPQFTFSYKSIPSDNFTSIKTILHQPQIFLIPETLTELYEYSMRVLSHQKDLPQSASVEESEVSEEPVKEVEDSTVKMEVGINSPEIIVVENALNEEPTSFVLHLGNSQVNLSTQKDRMKMSMRMNSFELYRCRLLSETLKKSNLSKLLQPVTMEANMGVENNIKTISVDLQSIESIVSFSDIRHLSMVYKSFTPLLETFNKTIDAESSEEDVIDEAKVEYGETKEVDGETKELVIDNESKELITDARKDDSQLIQLDDDSTAVESETERGEALMTMIVLITDVSVSLINDHIPANTYPSLKLIIENNETIMKTYREDFQEMYITIETLEMNTYNNKIASIEPVIEPWSLVLMYEKHHDLTKFHVQAEEVLDFNVTRSLMDTVVSINDLMKDVQTNILKDKESDDTSMISQSRPLSFYPFVIENKTGFKVLISTSTKPELKQSVQPDEELPLDISNTQKYIDRPVKHYLNVEFPDNSNFKRLENVPISRVGKNFYTLLSDISVVIEVRESHGTKFVLLRSTIAIKNQTSYDLQFAQHDKENDVPTNLQLIKAGHEYHMPLHSLRVNNLMFKVDAEGYEWRKYDSAFHRSFRELNIRNFNQNKFFHCWIRENPESRFSPQKDEVLTILPSLSVENTLCTFLSFRIIDIEHDVIIFEYDNLKPMELYDIYEFMYPKNVDKLRFEKRLTFANRCAIQIMFDGFNWSPKMVFKDKKSVFKLYDEYNRSLRIHMDFERVDLTRKLTFYSDYWIINHTGLNLFFKKPKSSKEAAGQRIQSKDHVHEHSDNAIDPTNWYKSPVSTIELQYAKNRFFYDHNRVCIKVENSPWSKDIPLGVKNEGIVSVDDPMGTKRSYQFSLVVEPGPGRLWRTKVVKIYPAFIIMNKTASTILYKQSSADCVYEIEKDSWIPFHWSKFDAKERRICFSDGKEENAWTPDISITDTGSFKAKIRTIYSVSDLVLDVIIKMIGNVTFVVVGDGSNDLTKIVTYKIVNRSNTEVVIEQKDSPSRLTLQPEESTDYCWDEPQFAEPRLLIRPQKADIGKKTEIDLDVISSASDVKTMEYSDGSKLRFEVRADGDEKTLYISDYSAQEEVAIIPKLINFHFTLSMRGIGVSVIDESPKELLYITFQSIFFDYMSSNLDQTLEIGIGAAQIDNQLYNSPLPILLYSAPVEDSPFFHLSMIKNNTTSKVQFFPYFAVKMQEIELNLEESLLVRLLAFSEFIIDYMYSHDQGEKVKDLIENVDEIPMIKDEDIASSDIYYFELFHINPLRVNITYLSNPDHDDVTLKAIAVQKLLGYIGRLTNIERAPLELNCLILEHPYCSKDDLVSRITRHYMTSALKQAYLILGSADFIGNPVSLFTNLGTGVKDFFYEPARGIVKSPKDFGVGIAKGTSSLLKKTIYGLFDTASKLTGTVAKVGSNLTFDNEYQKERSKRNQMKARHVGEGLAYGVRDFGIGIFKGITGVVVQPIKGAKKDGALGFFKGVGKGIAGVALKPTIGAVDLITRTTEGIKNTTTYFDDKLKAPIRPPRYFSEDGIVTVYNYEKSFGAQILHSLDQSKVEHESYVNHLLLTNFDCLVVTRKSIFLVDQAVIRFGYQWEIKWQVKISNVIGISLDERGKILKITEKDGTKVHERTIQCVDVEESRLCYQLLFASGIKLDLTEDSKKEIEYKLGSDIFETENIDLESISFDDRRNQRKRQRKERYADERTKLLGGGQKHYCSGCCC